MKGKHTHVDDLMDYTTFSKANLVTQQEQFTTNQVEENYFKKDEIDDWINKGRVKTINELNDESILLFLSKNKLWTQIG